MYETNPRYFVKYFRASQLRLAFLLRRLLDFRLRLAWGLLELFRPSIGINISKCFLIRSSSVAHKWSDYVCGVLTNSQIGGI